MTYEQWRSTLNFPEHRLKEYDDAKLSLGCSYPTNHKHNIHSFGKTESYPVYKHLRWINSRVDEFKVWAGPMIKSIEDVVYHHLFGMSFCPFVKHVRTSDRIALVKRLRGRGKYCYATDFTSFEKHFIPEVADAIEFQLYSHFLGTYLGADGLAVLHSALCGVNSLCTRSGVRVKVPGRRMSGDMWTSLGNGFTNLALAMFIAHSKGGHIEGIFEGDDGLFVSDVPFTDEDYLNCGFTIKIEQVQDPCSASFCGLIFGESGQVIRDPYRFIQNFAWTHSCISAGPIVMDQLLRAKALSALNECPHCPIVSCLAHYALEKTQHVLPRFVDDGYHLPCDISSIVPFDCHHDTRVLFEIMFGIDISLQLACEEAIRKGDMKALASLLPPKVLSKGVWVPNVDMLDYEAKYVVVG